MQTCVNRCRRQCKHMHTHTNTQGIHTPKAMFASHLQLGKLLSLVAGIFCIDELGEKELMELWALMKAIPKRVRQSE